MIYKSNCYDFFVDIFTHLHILSVLKLQALGTVSSIYFLKFLKPSEFDKKKESQDNAKISIRIYFPLLVLLDAFVQISTCSDT